MSLFSKIFKTEQNGSENKKKRNDLIPKLCCLFCAVGLWLVVSGETDIQDEKTYNGVPVEIVNGDVLSARSGLSIISGDDYIINITVRGNRSKLASYDSSAITAKVDVSKITEAGDHPLDVIVTPPPSSGFTIVKQSLDKIDVSVDKLSEKKFDVSVNVTSALHSSEYSFETTVNPSEVTVSGPQKLLDSINSASVNLDLGSINKDVGFNNRIVLVDKSGKEIDSPYITISDRYAEGTVRLVGNNEANEMSEKTVPLVCDYKYGYYNETNSSYTIEPKEVTVRGTKKDLAKIESINVCTIDETVDTFSTVFFVDIESPKGTTLVGDKRVKVTLEVFDNIGSCVVTMNQAEFSLPSESLEVELDGAFELKLIGDSQTIEILRRRIETFESGEEAGGVHPVKAMVDVSLVTRPGTYRLPVTVQFSLDEFKNVWSEAAEVYVRVS